MYYIKIYSCYMVLCRLYLTSPVTEAVVCAISSPQFSEQCFRGSVVTSVYSLFLLT